MAPVGAIPICAKDGAYRCPKVRSPMPEALKIPEYTPITPDNYVQITRAIRQAMAEGAEPEFVCLADPKEELEEGKVYAITQVDQDNEILFNIGKAMRHGMLNERNCVQSGTNVSLTCPPEKVAALAARYLADREETLRALVESFNQQHTFAVGDLVEWKPRMRNQKHPSETFSCVVMQLITPVEGDDPAEQVDMIVGSFGGTGPLQRYAVDSRRFQPFQGV